MLCGFGSMARPFGVLSSTPVGTTVERDGWSVTLLKPEKEPSDSNQVFWDVRLRNPSQGVDRRIPLEGLESHARLRFYLYPDLQRFVVFEPESNYRRKNRLLIYSFEGKRLHSLGLKDLLLPSEMDFSASDYGIHVFRGSPFTKEQEDVFRKTNRLILTTHTGRTIEVVLRDGTVKAYAETTDPPIERQKVLRILKDIQKILPPLPEDAAPAMYTFRHGKEVEADVSSFHVEGVWITPGHQGLATAVGYVEAFKGFHVTIGEGEIHTVLSEGNLDDQRILKRVEMDEVLTLARSLSSFSGDRAFRQNHRRILRDHGEALLFAARLLEAEYTEPAVTLAAFYLDSFEHEELEQEVGDALYTSRYLEILRTFEHDRNTARFMSQVDQLLSEGISRVKKANRRLNTTPVVRDDPFADPFATSPPDNRKPEAKKPDPFTFDVLVRPPEPAPKPQKEKEKGPDPLVDPFGYFSQKTSKTERATTEPLLFVPSPEWWCESEVGRYLTTWKASLAFEEYEAPAIDGFPVLPVQQEFYRKWYDRRHELVEVSRFLEDDLWLLFPERMARREVMKSYYQERHRIKEDPVLREKVEREVNGTRELLQDRISFIRTLPLMLLDPRPVPRSTQFIQKRQRAKGGTYLKRVPVPKTLADDVDDLLRNLQNVSKETRKLRRHPSLENALRLQEWIESFAGKNSTEMAWYFLDPAGRGIDLAALYTLLADADPTTKARLDAWIRSDPDGKGTLFLALKDYRRLDRRQADEWLRILAPFVEAESRTDKKSRMYRDMAPFYQRELKMMEVETPGKDTPEEIQILSDQIDRYLNIPPDPVQDRIEFANMMHHAWIVSADTFQTLLAERLISTPPPVQTRILNRIRTAVKSGGLEQEDLSYGAYNLLHVYLPPGKLQGEEIYRPLFQRWSATAWGPWLGHLQQPDSTWSQAELAMRIIRSHDEQDGFERLKTWSGDYKRSHPVYREVMVQLARSLLENPERFPAASFPDVEGLSADRKQELRALLNGEDPTAALKKIRALPPSDFFYLAGQVGKKTLFPAEAFTDELYSSGYRVLKGRNPQNMPLQHETLLEVGEFLGRTELVALLEKCRQRAEQGESGEITLTLLPIFGTVYVTEQSETSSLEEVLPEGVTVYFPFALNFPADQPIELGKTSSRPARLFSKEVGGSSAKEVEGLLMDWLHSKDLFFILDLKIFYQPDSTNPRP